MNKYQTLPLTLLTIAALSISAGNALANGPYRMDSRHRHGVTYPNVGIHLNVLPPHHSTIHYHNDRYHYYGGVWYHKAGPEFIVVAPPVGIMAPILPPHYTTIWYSGVPYYYGNTTYYVWRPEKNGYMVVEPPDEIVSGQPRVLAPELYVYPKLGQSEQQQADDRFECHKWALKETGYDPSQPPENVPTKERESRRDNYQRAIKACLDAKGYSIR